MKNVPNAQIFWSGIQASKIIRNAVSPEPSCKYYLWINPKEYQIDRLIDDLKKNDTSNNDIKHVVNLETPKFESQFKQKGLDHDKLMRLMSMYTQKKPVFSSPQLLPKIQVGSPKSAQIPNYQTIWDQKSFSTSTADPSLLTEFMSVKRPFSRIEHENRKKILTSMLSEKEIEWIRDKIQFSFKKNL